MRLQKSMEYATLLKVGEDEVISICPFDGTEDTLRVTEPFGRVICMSTSHVAFLDALGCDSVICGVSGVNFVSSLELRSRNVPDVGYDQAPDYEKIVALKPDVLLAFKVSSAESPFISKLESLGIRVFTLYEFLENHPLGRAEYIKAFGTVTGRRHEADSIFTTVSSLYNSLKVLRNSPNGLGPSHFSPEGSSSGPESESDSETSVKVLINIPYGDLWYIPGGDSYMSQLIKDAGGEILGAKEGETTSRTISLEEAYILSTEADIWLNTGWCRTRADLESANPLFGKFEIDRIYNNTLRTNPEGGNDFWESGCVRPDLILQDLRRIFSGEGGQLFYYVEVK
ncbi:MAG: ABC transporter substrate-binding protein [Bacteroidales bacterium]|nr:ABC transporter substrate-binding protein [Bacteroidales bacterium]